MLANPKILGVGNVWRGDDGVGPFVAQHLAANLPGLTVRSSDGEVSALLGEFENCGELLIIDAVEAESARMEPGTVLRLDVADPALSRIRLRASSSHSLGLMEALNLARTLGLLPGECEIIGVAGSEFAHRQGLSSPVQRAAERLVQELSRTYANA